MTMMFIMVFHPLLHPITFKERHERKKGREDIEYKQQMREAMRRSLEDYGRQDGQDRFYYRERGTFGR